MTSHIFFKYTLLSSNIIDASDNWETKGGSRKLSADGWDQSLAGDEGGEGGAPIQEGQDFSFILYQYFCISISFEEERGRNANSGMPRLYLQFFT